MSGGTPPAVRKAERLAWPSLHFPAHLLLQPVPLHSLPFSIGRAPSCSLAFRERKLLSAKHCELSMDNGNVKVTDFSSNGVTVNGVQKLVKGDSATLKDGDVVHLIKRKTPSTDDFSFVFLDAEDSSLAELEQTQELDETQPLENSDEPAEKIPKLTRVADDMAAAQDNEEPSGACSKEDSMADQLQCPICTELIHDCVTLQPCLHSFCSGCYSDWMTRSSKCPDCRGAVVRLSKNHLVNNVIATFLAANPDRKRSQEELQALDAKNHITQDMEQPQKGKVKKRNEEEDECEDEESEGSITDEDEEEDDEENSDYEEGDDPHPAHANMQFGVFGRAAIVHCRVCPATLASLPRGAAPPTGADGFRCTVNGQDHVLCQCCMEPFPDRRNATNHPPLQYLNQASVESYLQSKEKCDWETWEAYMEWSCSHWEISLPADDWRAASCSCRRNQNHGKCKHALAIAILKKAEGCTIPVSARIYGHKRKRGRPALAKKALLRQ